MLRKGFTLIELLVGMAIIGLVLAAATGSFFSLQTSWKKQTEAKHLLQNADWAMEFMSNELRQCDSVNVNAGALASGMSIRCLMQAPAQDIWFWRGDMASDAVQYGNQTYLYRGEGNNLNAAYSDRQVLAVSVADNAVDPATGSPYPIFSETSGIVALRLTVNQTINAQSKSLFLRTQVRLRD